MSVIVMLYGESGSGKSTSLRNFETGEVGIINVSGKPMPFRKKLPMFNSDQYIPIREVISKSKANSIVIDDSTYLMANEFMRMAKVTGYQKFTDMASNFWELVDMCRKLPDDKIVYFLGHIEKDADGAEKFKTIGKLLDEKITLEGMFTIVLKAVVQDGKHLFQTHNSGQDTVKSPMDMFAEDYIDNDLKAVDTIIRDYYGLTGGKNND